MVGCRRASYEVRNSVITVGVLLVTAASLVACTGQRPTFDSMSGIATTSTVSATVGTNPDQRPTLAALAEQCRSAGASVGIGGVLFTGVDHSGVLEAFQATYPGVHVAADLAADINPDVIEAGPSEVQSMIDAGQSVDYTPSFAAEVPSVAKGRPVWAYSSMVVFAIDRTRVARVPTSFQALNNAAYAGQAHLVGDPRSDPQARAVVMAASMAAGGDPSDTARGSKYFASATQAGVFVADQDAPIAVGTTTSLRATIERWQGLGHEVTLWFPADGLAGVPYTAMLMRGTEHQACGRLWIEHLLSDDGGLSMLLAHTIPARLASLRDRGLLTADMVAMVPTAAQWSKAVQFTDAQLHAAQSGIDESVVWK